MKIPYRWAIAPLVLAAGLAAGCAAPEPIYEIPAGKRLDPIRYSPIRLRSIHTGTIDSGIAEFNVQYKPPKRRAPTRSCGFLWLSTCGGDEYQPPTEDHTLGVLFQGHEELEQIKERRHKTKRPLVIPGECARMDPRPIVPGGLQRPVYAERNPEGTWVVYITDPHNCLKEYDKRPHATQTVGELTPGALGGDKIIDPKPLPEPRVDPETRSKK